MANIKVIRITPESLRASHVGVPADVRIVSTLVDHAGVITLELESASFPFVPDGMPPERIPQLTKVGEL